MKPTTSNNISFLGGLGLIVLFCLPYIGDLALIICAFFIPEGSVKKFARGFLIFCVVVIIIDVILTFVTGGSFNFEYYKFPLLQEEELEAFKNILNIA
ncbi:MAG: hypothetical protein E7676_00225 [Ruminococcaceae bacterium]|nr:hypothetical protein [Oscillospiraceae bacterium]